MSVEYNQSQPWLDSTGVMLSDDVLKVISQKWNPETWELFLVETVERSQSYMRETLLKPWVYESILDEMTDSIWAGQQSPESEDVCALLRRIIRDHLTPRQQHIIRLLFWEGLSARETGTVLGISAAAVSTHKFASFNKLQRLLEARLEFPPLSERTAKRSERTKTREEQIREVYQEELNNFYGRVGGL